MRHAGAELPHAGTNRRWRGAEELFLNLPTRRPHPPLKRHAYGMGRRERVPYCRMDGLARGKPRLRGGTPA